MSSLDAYKPSKRSSSSQGSDAAASDVEDLKTDIPPYFDETATSQQQQQQQLQHQQQQQQQQHIAWSPNTDVDAGADAAEVELDDSYADSAYGASGSGSAANSYYQSPTPSNSDIMLRPPSNTSFHYGYPSPGASSSSVAALSPSPGSSGPGPGLGPGPGPGGARLHAAYTHSQTTPVPCFYPNMWYPNASYGNAGYARYGNFGQAAVAAAGAGSSAGYSHMLPHGQHHTHPHPHHHHGHHPHHAAHPGLHTHPHETMMEMFQLSNSGREARNRAEKNRRDKLNGSIQELSTMVPHVAESPRRVDKTAVLRFAAHGLRLNHVFGRSLHEERPEVIDTLMNMMDSFFLVLTCHGQILLISTSIEQHLGHCQSDLYGQSILQITHPEDHEMLKQQLIPTELENLFDAHAESTDGEGSEQQRQQQQQRAKSEEDYIDRKLRDDKRSFRVRLARAGPRSEPTAYEVVKIDGCFRRSDEAPRGVRSNTFSSSLQLIRRTRGRDDAIPLHTISGNDIVLTGVARIIRPPKIVNRLVDANRLEYRTRHLIDGRIIDCDQRIGLVAGYMTDEVRNLSPFTFMHNDDVRWVIVALRQMYDCNSSYGESTYRLFTRNGNIIYLQSKGFLEIDKETNKVHSFVCVNTLLDDEEGRRRVQEMKKKFSVIIKTRIPQSTVDVPASEHPAQLEKAVLCLIQNLQHSGNGSDTDQQGDDDDDDGDEDDDEFDDSSVSGAADYQQLAGAGAGTGARALEQQQQQQQQHSHHGHGQHSFMESPMSQARLSAGHGMSSSKTPPLALVPPKTDTVKSSISRSVSVVNVTAAKRLRQLQATSTAAAAAAAAATAATSAATNLKSPSGGDSCSCLSPGDMDCDYCQSPLTPELVMSSSSSGGGGGFGGCNVSLKRSSAADTLEDEQELKLPKRFMPTTEIQHVLSNSLEQIGRNLSQQLNVARNLRDQGNRYELPHDERIDALMEEHQEQSKLYVNIKSEYEEQLQHNKANTAQQLKTETEAKEAAGSTGAEQLSPR
ncbi:aryl hydrocarbon receptor nuclear translocator homolog isoform X2 [Drosophila busckii]|uniref:aryl hydrocarbon receptor nuclear translocator homolog isoform X2 n=1 Tax=Drosophila busckii TaxID=30019 RepID=UPI00083EA84B|nr:aryl hydrocarbon receptor nuclear translocator homolog isoform X2 [Drosophila busckii]